MKKGLSNLGVAFVLVATRDLNSVNAPQLAILPLTTEY